MSYHYYVVYEHHLQNDVCTNHIMGSTVVILKKKIKYIENLIEIGKNIAKELNIEDSPVITFYELLRKE